MGFIFITDDNALAKLSGLNLTSEVEHCPFMVGDLISGPSGISWRVTKRWYSDENKKTGKPAHWYVFVEVYGDPLVDQDPQLL